jgi:hypothetical protein
VRPITLLNVRAEFRPGRDFEPTPVGLQLPDKAMHFEQWAKLGRRLAMLHNASAWALGDWIRYGDVHYQPAQENRYDEAVALTGLARQSLKNYASVARRFPLERRRAKLSYGLVTKPLSHLYPTTSGTSCSTAPSARAGHITSCSTERARTVGRSRSEQRRNSGRNP